MRAKRIVKLYTPCPVCGKDKWIVHVRQTATTTATFVCKNCRENPDPTNSNPGSFTKDYLLGYSRGRLDNDTKYRKEVAAGATRTLTVVYTVRNTKISNPRFPKGKGHKCDYAAADGVEDCILPAGHPGDHICHMAKA